MSVPDKMAGTEQQQDAAQSESTIRRGKGLRCAVFGCSNMQSDGYTMHSFPKDAKLSRMWTKLVATCRENFGPAYGTPTKYSAVCHVHFDESCYPASFSLMKSMGMKAKRCLLPGSVPTIQKPVRNESLGLQCTASVTETVTVSYQSTAAASATYTVCSVSAPICSVSMVPGVSDRNVRSAFRKRETRRILGEVEQEYVAVDERNSSPDIDAEEVTAIPQADNLQQQHHASCQTTIPGDSLSMVYNQSRKPKRSKCLQARPKYAQKSVQTDPPSVCTQSVSTRWDSCDVPVPSMEVVSSEEESEMEPEEENVDTDYAPSTSCEDTDTTDSEIHSPVTQHTAKCKKVFARKYIVFEDNLLQLFDKCHSCSQAADRKVTHTMGTLVSVTQTCAHCQHTWTWKSQPFIKDIPAGNLLLSAAILLSGSVPLKAIRLLGHMGIASIASNTFYMHQRTLLHPAVLNVWEHWQQKYVNACRESGSPLVLGGDGRADSPGHCAKFGTYTLMDLNTYQVCRLQLVQSNEVANSSRMEKEGLQQAVTFFSEHGLEIAELVTDRHPQIIKFVADNMKNTKHSVDVWHVAKGLKKKLVRLASERDCTILSEWIKSVVNHLYWVAASTPDGNVQMMSEKLFSLANHLHNIHTHSGPFFPVCAHLPLDNPRKKKWFTEGSKVSVKLLDILQSRQMKKDIGMLATGPQTAALEAFHAVLNHFCPKMTGFSYEGMLSRNLVAALHFNENGNRRQAADKDGNLRFDLVFKKSKSDFTLQEIKQPQTFRYVDVLMDMVVRMAEQPASLRARDLAIRQQPGRCPPPLCSAKEKPDKTQAVLQFRSRYHKE